MNNKDSTDLHHGRQGKPPSAASEEKPTFDNVHGNNAEAHLDFPHIDSRKILRKMDLRLLPILMFLYIPSFLDRSNIGNAKIEGMLEDLHMSGSDYNWVATVYFLAYCLFDIPSTVLVKKLRPSIWLPAIMATWGVITTLTGVVQGYHGLLATRILLGAAEAGYYPGAVFYITLWYCGDDAQYRQALLASAVSIAGAFSGLLAFLIAVGSVFRALFCVYS